jgi:multiple sugar transport system substrate-binding protein
MALRKTSVILASLGSLLVSAAFPTAIALAADTSGEPVHLRFTFWGSAFEKKDITAAIDTFNATHPNIKVEGQHIPNAGYVEKITTQLAAGDPPDIAYLDETQAFPWSADGKLLDLTPYFNGQPERTLVKNIVYRAGDHLIGTGLATGVILTYYNKDIFDKAGVPYPPARADRAWTWDEFLANAKKLTKDRAGHDAADPAFDPDQIETYGVAISPHWWGNYIPFIYSAGGKVASDDGKQLLLNSPESVDALQKIQDLFYKWHVAPTPTQAKNLPTADILMQSKKVAIAIDGMWKVTDFANLRFPWGVGVLPKIKEPVTVTISVPKVIFAATKHPKEAFEFYEFLADPTKVALFKEGLWAPLDRVYFTDPAKEAEWLTAQPGVYPPEAKDAIVDYELNHSPYQPPEYWLKNINRITEEAITPALDQVWEGRLTAQQGADLAVKNAGPLLQGRW